MNKLNEFIVDFHYQLEENGYETCFLSQSELKNKIQVNGYETCFPMISYEKSCDNSIISDINESLFLNDSDYDNDWIGIYKDGELFSFICLQNGEDEDIDIGAFEINTEYRGQGYAKKIINIFENCAYDNDYVRVCLTPFDSNASSFWEYMDYDDEGFYFIKELGV